MRTEITFRLECSVCHSQLEADNKKTLTTCDSASQIATKMAIVPCRTCISRATAPARAIKAALESISKEEL